MNEPKLDAMKGYIEEMWIKLPPGLRDEKFIKAQNELSSLAGSAYAEATFIKEQEKLDEAGITTKDIDIARDRGAIRLMIGGRDPIDLAYPWEDFTDILEKDGTDEPVGPEDIVMGLGVDAAGDEFLLPLGGGGDNPHWLIAGASGSGKSELIRTMVSQMVNTYTPEQLTMAIYDPNGGDFDKLAETKHCVKYHTKNTLQGGHAVNGGAIIQHAWEEIETREVMMQQLRRRLPEANVQNLKQYNSVLAENPELLEEGILPMPVLLVLVDEVPQVTPEAARASDREVKDQYKENRSQVSEIASYARKFGIVLMLAGQDIKDNALPTDVRRQCRVIALKLDAGASRNVLDGDSIASEVLQGGAGRAIYRDPSDGFIRFRAFFIDGKGESMRNILETATARFGTSGIDTQLSWREAAQDEFAFDPDFDEEEEELDIEDILGGIWTN